jgi:cytidylate kinase
MIIVIDGPAGSGKSSTAKAVARELDIQYLDSGALYRALTIHFLKCDCQEQTFIEQLDDLDLQFRYEDGLFRVWLNTNEVTAEIRSMKVSEQVSTVAGIPEARSFVNKRMKERIREDVFIAEGRDLGTSVFPDAALKFFMIASVEKRAERRLKELREKGEEVTLEAIIDNIRKRDEMDSGRDTDPLKQSDQAILIDTSDLSFEEQVDVISSKIRNLVKI